MQYKNDKTVQLRKAIGEIISIERVENTIYKSCNSFENAYDFSSGSIYKIENAKIDCKVITLWKVAEALGLKPSELLKIIEDKLGDKFKLIDE